MRSSLLSAFALVVASTAACGETPPPVATPPAASAAPDSAPSAAASPAPAVDKSADTVPTECADKGSQICVPPAAFVKRFCLKPSADVALFMMAKGTPWARGYLRVKSANALNASGGASSDDKLVFEEEFLIITHRQAPAGGMTVSGAGEGYDVLRWDGSCVTLSGEEVAFQVPPKPKYAKIPWKILDDKTQEALLKDDKIAKTNAERRKECKGATMGDVTLKCQKADEALTALVVNYIRGGGSIPTPKVP